MAPAKNVQCNECSYEASARFVQKHMEGVHLKIKHECDICGLKFSQRSSMLKHIQSCHLGSTKKEKCNECNYESSPHHLRRHTQSVHNPQRIKFKCDQCDSQYLSNQRLSRHVNYKHLGIKHKCKECHYEIGSKLQLKEHVNNVHLNIRYNCDQCGASAT